MKVTGQSENKFSDTMTFSDHLEELRQRILNSIYSILISIFCSFLIIKPLISFLEIPAGDIHLLQLAPGEFLFVAIKVAGYSGLIVSMPYIFYQVILFSPKSNFIFDQFSYLLNLGLVGSGNKKGGASFKDDSP